MWTHQEEIGPTAVGLSGVALSGSSNSNWIECRRAAQITLEFDIVNATGAALTPSFYIDTQRLGESSGVARLTLIGAPAAPVGSVMDENLYQHHYVLPATAAVAETYRYSYELGNTAQAFRISGLTAAGAGVGDVVSVHVRISY